MTDRSHFASLFEYVNLAIREPEEGRTEFEDEAYRNGYLIIYQTGKGRNSYVATVSRDDIFDDSGNRFI